MSVASRFPSVKMFVENESFKILRRNVKVGSKRSEGNKIFCLYREAMWLTKKPLVRGSVKVVDNIFWVKEI